MALYQDGKPVSGLNSIPRLTLAQYNALNVKPDIWIRTDAPESYKKLSADQVSYDSNNTVEDMIDNLNTNLNRFKVVYNNIGNQVEVVNIDNNYHTYLVTCYGGGVNMQVAIASFRSSSDYRVENLVGSGVTSDGSKITFAFTNYHIASVIQLA